MSCRVRMIALLVLVGASCRGGGLNLPPTQGSSNAGAFAPGIYVYNYSDSILDKIKAEQFSHFRLLVNVETANDRDGLRRIVDLFDALGNQGVICMIDTNEEGETAHGNGRPNDLDELASAWGKVFARFRNKPDVLFEIFNEPFGYKTGIAYLDDMKYVIRNAQVPASRCVLDGMGYAHDIKSVIDAGWSGAVAYHFYPNWVAKNLRTASNYSKRVLSDLSGVKNDIYITEFGANLGLGDVYETDVDANSNTAALAGLHDALLVLKQPVLTYHWHGWDNGDRYSFWGDKNQFGAQKIRDIGTAQRNKN